MSVEERVESEVVYQLLFRPLNSLLHQHTKRPGACSLPEKTAASCITPRRFELPKSPTYSTRLHALSLSQSTASTAQRSTTKLICILQAGWCSQHPIPSHLLRTSPPSTHPRSLPLSSAHIYFPNSAGCYIGLNSYKACHLDALSASALLGEHQQIQSGFKPSHYNTPLRPVTIFFLSSRSSPVIAACWPFVIRVTPLISWTFVTLIRTQNAFN